ncbi:hypothetical protein [Hyalangium sp.]|uniref:hypothetical protein n=1 Tax=Hyalangium sp. TaxID=2028555 RepID=UPI002D36DCAE|nr:hypothetical protein [Hyalangium sp.]HYI00420.1 hypothetical protein [Hyalangium sp.]
MKRSLLSLLLLGALAACNDKPPGQLEPIPRPAGYQEPPKEEAPKRTEPAPDPNKVVLRWKLAVGTPVAFRLEGTPEAGGSALKAVYVLQHPQSGDNVLRIARNTAPEEGTFSERGFILDGLGSVDRNLATILLELPKDPVGVGDTWTLGTDLVNPEPLGPNFNSKKSDRRNAVKLASLTPEGDDRVATLEYELSELVSGSLPPGAPLAPGAASETSPLKAAPEKGKGKGKKPATAVDHHDERSRTPLEITSEVTFKGSGQFLVKAGRWRSWQGTLSSKTQGYTPAPGKSPAQVPPGTLRLQLTALDSVPAELLQPAAKK